MKYLDSLDTYNAAHTFINCKYWKVNPLWTIPDVTLHRTKTKRPIALREMTSLLCLYINNMYDRLLHRLHWSQLKSNKIVLTVSLNQQNHFRKVYLLNFEWRNLICFVLCFMHHHRTCPWKALSAWKLTIVGNLPGAFEQWVFWWIIWRIFGWNFKNSRYWCLVSFYNMSGHVSKILSDKNNANVSSR